MPDPRKTPPMPKPEAAPAPKDAEAPQPDKQLKPQEPPGDVPGIGEEFTLSGTDQDYWKHPIEEESTEFLL
jgi:hypothetical protein